ncbi:hypothetical protein MRB53_015486 [Persea americana]|uniref:Uncharacterized protein n=1 Tax=Persea americana TaxID=3435 RepID=A0ACC2M0Q4_PERAE|nr:hypothetical protein MRB53_015486 [Persea americana]
MRGLVMLQETPIIALKKYIIENNVASESELMSIDKKIDEVTKDAVEFADASPCPPRSQLLENVFADPKAKKASYAARDPITALKKYTIENNLASESELKVIDKKIDEVIDDALELADASPHPPRSQLLENVFT